MEIKFDQNTLKMPSKNCRSLFYTSGVIKDDSSPREAVGIDPGVNFGLTFIHAGFVHIYHGVLTQERVPGRYAIRAYYLFKELDLPELPACIIEGAAYHKQFRQVVLGETRIGFYMYAYLSEKYMMVKIVPPASIRKAVAGDSRKHASDEYPNLNANAADSLYCALYGGRM